ncbi:MAG TPA: STAS domain-containing protein [Burkholderiaceae bacterium]
MEPTLALPAELTIYNATDICQRWLAWLQGLPAGSTACTLDARHVAEVDGAGLQLLAGLAGALQARGLATRLVEPQETLRDACRSLGLDGLLGNGNATGEHTP